MYFSLQKGEVMCKYGLLCFLRDLEKTAQLVGEFKGKW
jgi:hypothetical protein